MPSMIRSFVACSGGPFPNAFLQCLPDTLAPRETKRAVQWYRQLTCRCQRESTTQTMAEERRCGQRIADDAGSAQPIFRTSPRSGSGHGEAVQSVAHLIRAHRELVIIRLSPSPGDIVQRIHETTRLCASAEPFHSAQR